MERDFLTLLGHEVRTPITSLKGAVDLLHAKALGTVPGQLLPLLDIAKRNSDRLTRLVEDLMLIGEFRASDITRDLRPVDPEPLLRAAMAARQGKDGAPGSRFMLHGGSVGACVQAAPVWLTRALARMLDLAVPSSGDTAEPIVVSLQRRAGSIRFACPVPAEIPRHDGGLLVAGARSDIGAAPTDLGMGIITAIIAEHGGHVGSDAAPDGMPRLTISLPECQLPRTGAMAVTAATIGAPGEPD